MAAMLKNSLFYSATSLSNSLEDVWSKAFAPLCLTPSQAFVLRVILHEKIIEKSRLFKSLYVTKIEATKILSELKEKGLIKQLRCNKLSSSLCIKPTPNALEIQQKLYIATESVIHIVNENLGHELYLDILAKIYKSNKS